MGTEISGFIQEGRFDLNSYLTYLFKKIHKSPNEEKKK
jgi:hypothetical protein